MSRRCLQNLLVGKGAKKKFLAEQITEMYDTFPPHVRGYIDAIRKVGNLSAHPWVSASTGEIVDIEPAEAEWMLDLLDALFDHYYTKRAELTAKLAALDAKVADAERVKPKQKAGAP